MGNYFFNADDISDKNLDRGWHLIASELERMTEEIKVVRTNLEAREAMREGNFADSGGHGAFTQDELRNHATEGYRLERHMRRCNLLIAELDQRSRIIRDAWSLNTNAPV